MLSPDHLDWLREHIESHMGFEFIRGRRDCSTFNCAWIDRVSGSSELQAVYGQYGDRKTAIRFQRAYGDLHAVLERNGWAEHRGPPVDGDIATFDDPPFVAGHIYWRAHVWCINEDKGLVSRHVGMLTGLRPRWWRFP